MENPNGIILIVWELEDRMEKAEGSGNIRCSEESGECFHWEGIEQE